MTLKLQSFALVMEQLLELLEESDLREHDLKGNAQNILKPDNQSGKHKKQVNPKNIITSCNKWSCGNCWIDATFI